MAKKKKYGNFGGYRKFCGHARGEWDLCTCAWFYTVQHAKTRYRGQIPNVANEAEAKVAYALLAARIRAGQSAFEPKPTAATGMTVRQLGEEWLALPRQRKPSMIQSYRDHLRAHIYPSLGSRVAATVTADECEQLIVNLKPLRFKRPLSLSTKKGVARTLHTLFAFALSKRLRTDNPCAGLVRAISDPTQAPTVAIDTKDLTKYFPPEESQHLLATCRANFPEWHPLVLTALQTGMRQGELRGLLYKKINWRKSIIVVDEAYVDGRWTTPKNGKSRNVSMSRDLRALLYLRWRTAGRPGGLVFPSRVGTPLETSRIQRFWRALLSESDLNYRKFHSMRHTHDSLLIQAGVPPAMVAAESGRSLEETMRTYAHFAPDGNVGNAEVLAGLLSGRDSLSLKRSISGNQRPRTATNLRRVV